MKTHLHSVNNFTSLPSNILCQLLPPPPSPPQTTNNAATTTNATQLQQPSSSAPHSSASPDMSVLQASCCFERAAVAAAPLPKHTNASSMGGTTNLDSQSSCTTPHNDVPQQCRPPHAPTQPPPKNSYLKRCVRQRNRPPATARELQLSASISKFE